MSINEEVVLQARQEVGCVESPPGSNGGACVRRIQSSTGAYLAAWCVSFIFYVWQQARLDYRIAPTASTWGLVKEGSDAGILENSPVMGGALVWNPGPRGHAEIFVRMVSSTIAITIGGNTGDAVREHERSIIGAYRVVPKALLEVPKYVTKYYWEDPLAKPERHGDWDTYGKMKYNIEAWVKKYGNPGHVRPHQYSKRVNGRLVPRWYFLTGPRKRSIPFDTKAGRDNDKALVEKRTGHKLRTYSEKELVKP